ncbi:MAG: amidohydrolase [Thermomicrobiales bacterium]|nr:amidohydrolase [Thermomicrobiales bacterium]
MITDTIKNEIDEILPGVVADRRHLHEHPELGFEENETSKFVIERLQALGVDDIRTGLAVTGVTALVHGTKPGEGKCVLLRADMDALPIVEENAVDYVSQNKGVMHACGHDAHTAMLLGVARVLMDNRDTFSGTVKLLFQPSEEQGTGGALPMIEQGVLEDPHVDAVFGQHVSSGDPTGEIHVAPGPNGAAADSWKITINGKGGHGAAPHQTVDPIIIATNIINALQTIVSRGVDPMAQTVVSVCNIHSGFADNVIPDTCELGGTVRTFDPKLRDFAQDRLTTIAETVAKSFGGSATVNYHRGYPATINDAEMSELVRLAAIEAVGEDMVKVGEPGMGAEDFSYFLENRPGCFWNVGTRNEERGIVWPHHHPRFDVDEDGMSHGIKTMVNVALTYLNS